MKKTFLFLSFIINLFFLQAQEKEKPLIGISCTFSENEFSSVRKTYTESVLKSGGLPILIPITTSEEDLRLILSQINALILIGGEDIDPSYYKEKPIKQLGDINKVRDTYDFLLIQLACESNLPILGICRGLQAINVFFGGSLYQDIPSQYADNSVNHQQKEPSRIATHTLQLHPNSMLAAVTGKSELHTNTHHHQAIKEIATGFRATAWSSDGIIEAIESNQGLPIWAVQFHPEGQAFEEDPTLLSIFHFLTEQAIAFQQLTNNQQ